MKRKNSLEKETSSLELLIVKINKNNENMKRKLWR